MSYSTEIEKDFLKSHFLIKITPRLSLTGFALNSSNIYRVSYTTGYVTTVGSKTTRKNSVAELTANTHFYQDFENGYLYIYSSSAVASDDAFITKFEIYFSTLACVWHRDPTDTSTDLVEWESNIASPPEISSALGEQAFGTVIIDASGFDAIYDPSVHQYLLSASSFKNCPVNIYHVAGELSVANIESSFSGILDERVSCDMRRISFGIVQKSFERYGAIQTHLGLGGVSDPNLNYQTQQLRAVMGSTGVHDDTANLNIRAGLIPWNRNYNDTAPTTSNNRIWVIGWDIGYGFNGELDGSTINAGAPTGSGGAFYGDAGCWTPELINLGKNPSPAYPSNPTYYKTFDYDLTYLSDFLRFAVGDNVKVRNNTSATTFYTTIEEVISVSGGQDLKFAVDIGSGNVTVTKYMVDEVFLIQSNVRYDLKPVRDFTVAHDGGGSDAARIQLTLTSSAESNVGAATFNPANGDYLICTIKSFGMIRSVFEGSLTKSSGLIGRIYWHLTRAMQIPSSDIDIDSFNAAIAADTSDTGEEHLQDDSAWTLGLQPLVPGDTPPNHSDLLNKMLLAAGCCLFYGANGLVTIKNLNAATSVGTIDLEEIAEDSIDYEYDFTDIDNVIYTTETVEEAALLGTSTSYREAIPYSTINTSDPDSGGADTELHEIRNPRRVSMKPTTLRSNRKGSLTLKTTLKLSSENVGSTITVRSKFLQGFEYDGVTTHEADYVISQIKKSVDGVEVVLNV